GQLQAVTAGGLSSAPAIINTILLFTFATETDATAGTSLSATRGYHAGAGDWTRTYWAGGIIGGGTAGNELCQRWTYATSALASVTSANLSSSHLWLAAG